MGLKLVLLFGCLAYVTCRTVTVQKTSLSLTEDSQETDDIREILQTFLGNPDVISDLQNGDIGKCSKGKCNFCKKILKHNACFVATLGKNSITIEVTMNGKNVMKKVITVPNPPAVCKKSIPGVPLVKDVCIQVKNINLKNASGCVYISFKLGVKKVSVKIECFKIPHDDVLDVSDDVDATLEIEDIGVESIDLQDGTLKFQPFSNNS